MNPGKHQSSKQRGQDLGPFYTCPKKFSHGQNFAWFHLAFTRDRRNWTNFEPLSVQVWYLKKAGQLFDRHGSDFSRTRVNTRTVQLFAQIARLWPGIYSYVFAWLQPS